MNRQTSWKLRRKGLTDTRPTQSPVLSSQREASTYLHSFNGLKLPRHLKDWASDRITAIDSSRQQSSHVNAQCEVHNQYTWSWTIVAHSWSQALRFAVRENTVVKFSCCAEMEVFPKLFRCSAVSPTSKISDQTGLKRLDLVQTIESIKIWHWAHDITRAQTSEGLHLNTRPTLVIPSFKRPPIKRFSDLRARNAKPIRAPRPLTISNQRKRISDRISHLIFVTAMTEWMKEFPFAYVRISVIRLAPRHAMLHMPRHAMPCPLAFICVCIWRRCCAVRVHYVQACKSMNVESFHMRISIRTSIRNAAWLVYTWLVRMLIRLIRCVQPVYTVLCMRLRCACNHRNTRNVRCALHESVTARQRDSVIMWQCGSIRPALCVCAGLQGVMSFVFNSSYLDLSPDHFGGWWSELCR